MTCLKPIKVFITERELATRWGTSIKMLQSNRQKGVGIAWVKIGRLVRYNLQDIEAFEESARCGCIVREGGYPPGRC